MTSTTTTFVCECGRRHDATTVVQEIVVPGLVHERSRCDAPKTGSVQRCYLEANHPGTHSWQA